MSDDAKDQVKRRLILSDVIRADGIPLSGGPNEWAALCPFHKEQSPSFTINDEKAFFHCFGCGANGDVFEWRMRRAGEDFPAALRHLASRANVTLPEYKKKVWQPRDVQEAGEAFREPPSREALDRSKFRPLVEGGKVWNYLTQTRGLRPEFLEAYRVQETADGEAYAFPYQWLHPRTKKLRVEFLKIVKVDREPKLAESGQPTGKSKKIEWREPKGGVSILFGMLAVPTDCRRLLIAEGELDSITWAQYGQPAVSVPGGAGALGWIDLCWDWLEKFEKIYISFDEDRAGYTKIKEIVQRLGTARTDIVRLPMREKNQPDEEAAYIERLQP